MKEPNDAEAEQQLLRSRATSVIEACSCDKWQGRHAHNVACVLQERLEGDLTTYKANLVKESIRMGHNDLGDFFYAAGDLQAGSTSCP